MAEKPAHVWTVQRRDRAYEVGVIEGENRIVVAREDKVGNVYWCPLRESHPLWGSEEEVLIKELLRVTRELSDAGH